jgi:hypothetical protein
MCVDNFNFAILFSGRIGGYWMDKVGLKEGELGVAIKR